MTVTTKTQEVKPIVPAVTPVAPVIASVPAVVEMVATPVAPVETIAPMFNGKLIVKLANEIKQAQQDTSAVTLGSSKLGSQDQVNRKGKRGNESILMLRKYDPNETSDIYKLGDIDPSDESKTLEKGNEILGKLNATGQANKARIELLNNEYENPKESYDNPAILAMVHNGVLLRAGNLILKSYSGAGVADKVVGLHLVRRIAKWSIADRDILYNEIKTLTVGEESMSKIDRETIESLANLVYDALNKMHGFNAVEKTAAKSGDSKSVSLDDLLAMDLTGQVTIKSVATKSPDKSKGQSNNAPTHPGGIGNTYNPANILAAAKEGKPETIQATPTVVSSTATKQDDPAQLAAIEAAKIEANKPSEPESKPDETKTPDPVKPKTEETKTTK